MAKLNNDVLILFLQSYAMVPGLSTSGATGRDDRQATMLSIGGFTRRMDAQRRRQSDRWRYKRESHGLLQKEFSRTEIPSVIGR